MQTPTHLTILRRSFVNFRSLSAIPIPKIRGEPQAHLFHYNQTIIRLSKLGKLKDARHLFDTMPRRDTVSYNSMISAYIQHNNLGEANKIFENALEYKNVRTWTILLSGYAKAGLVNEALEIFKAMPERNIVSWNAMLSGYLHKGDLKNGRRLFDEMLVRDVSSWNSMITGYSRSGLMSEARELFDTMEEKNCVTWMVMVSGYVERSEYREGWSVFLMMMRNGVRIGQGVFVVGFSAVIGLNNLDLIESLRSVGMKLGYEEDVVVGTAVLNAYMRSGSLDDAVKFFDGMPERNDHSWTSMIAAFSRCGRLDDANALYERNNEKGGTVKNAMIAAYMQNGKIDDARCMFDEILNPDVVAWNSILAGYAQNGMIEEAKDTFLRMPLRNAASWAAMIACLVQYGFCKEGLNLFSLLHKSGTIPNHSSFTSALSACAKSVDVELGKQIHSLAIKTRCWFNLYVGNGLLSMYAKCNKMEDASQVFSTMRVRDNVSWNSLISGFSENYMLDGALSTFENMPIPDVVSWTSTITAYVQAGREKGALQMFHDMLFAGVKPTDVTVISLLSACGNLGATKLGEQFHALIFKHGFDSCLSVCNALITMYFKCCSLDGLCVFQEMLDRDIITWNATIHGCAENGRGKEAIEIFKQMEAAGVFPDEISFLGILRACILVGLVDEGWDYYISMTQDYGITPLISHYACMVDLLGLAGRFSKAEALIQSMPVEMNSLIRDTLLSACRVHSNIQIGQRAADSLV